MAENSAMRLGGTKTGVTYNLTISIIHLRLVNFYFQINPIALRKAKIVYNFGLSECNRVKRLSMKEIIFHSFLLP